MADHVEDTSVTATLTGTTADTAVLKAAVGGGRGALVIVNWDDTERLFFTWRTGGGAAPVATGSGDNCIPVMPLSSTCIPLPNMAATVAASIVGNGNEFTACVIPVIGT